MTAQVITKISDFCMSLVSISWHYIESGTMLLDKLIMLLKFLNAKSYNMYDITVKYVYIYNIYIVFSMCLYILLRPNKR